MEDRVPAKAGAREEAGVAAGAADGAVVLPQAPAATACAPTVGSERRTKWGSPAMSSNAPSAGRR